MEPRYTLRFDNGERKGETIPIPPAGLTVGRKPGHGLQILDNSVSGQHAELGVDKYGVTLKDTGSTNGTRVNGERVLEKRLTHGDLVVFGTVELRFADSELAAKPATSEQPAHIPAPVPHAGRGEGLERVSPELLARSRKVSRPGLIVLALALAGGGVWWWLNRSATAPSASVKAVEPVPGNLLADDYSFEGEHDGWSGVENAPQAFLRSSQAAVSGLYGLAAELGRDEWARTRSKEVAVDPEKELVGRAALRVGEGARLRLGIEFGHGLADPGQPAGFIAWSRTLSEPGRNATVVEISAGVPPGYDRARLVVDAHASGPGRASFDDGSLVVRGAAAKPVAEAGDARLFRSRVLFSAFEFVPESGEPLAVAARADGTRISITTAAADARTRRVSLLVDGDLARGGIATLGADKNSKDGGFRSHGGGDFERGGVGALLFGSGRDLIALRTSTAVAAKGVREGSGVRVSLEFPAAPGELGLQTDFREERKEAGNVAHDARAAEKKGDLGECLRQWSLLLDNYPYEEQLVKEAQDTRARLVQQGLGELRKVKGQIERARFFRLPELYQKCRDDALAVGKRFSGSEVEEESRSVAAALESDLSGAESERRAAERKRLELILRALQASQSTGLAAEVESALARSGGSK